MRPLFTLVACLLFLGGCLDIDDSGDTSGFYEDTPGNDSPIINGSPNTAVVINDMYEFEPEAQDPDGDPLTFSIQNKPVWTIFDSRTGRLVGQPTPEHIGTYTNIVVTVTDGEKSDALPAFEVTVTDSALGSVSLNWLAPTQNEDGTPLTDLAGYKIYYGKASGTYNNEVIINNPGQTTHVVNNLLPDTYYFTATAFNAAGIESGYAGEAIRSIN